MDTQLNSLEEKLGQLLDQCAVLRTENQRLRQQVVTANDKNKQLKERVTLATLRLDALLSKFPESD